MAGPRVAVAPTGVRGWLADAVRDGGGEVVEPHEAEALVWAETNKPKELEALLRGAGSGVRWVQLPYAGIEPFVHLVQDDRDWTCGKGIFAEPVAELALTLALAGLRGLGTYVKSTTWLGESGRNLVGGKVTILGGGGIASALVRMLKPVQ